MSDDTETPREVFDAACRRLCRRIAAAIIRLMADTDTDVETIAARLGESPENVQRRLDRLIRGQAITLNEVSDLAFSMAAEFEFIVSECAREEESNG